MAFGSSFALIPTYNHIFQYACHRDEDSQANATSALYNIVYALGAFLGPTMAGWLGDAIGYGMSYTWFAMFLILLLIPLIIVTPCLRGRLARTASQVSITQNVDIGSVHHGPALQH